MSEVGSKNLRDRWMVWAALLLTISGCVRLAVAHQFPLSPDEAYYWLWSQFPDWSYFSKGPLVAWTIWLGTAIGGDHALGVRWPAVVLHVGTGWLLFYLGRRLYDGRVGWWALVTALCIPIFALGSIVMTIDPLSVFFWLAAAVCAWRAVESDSVLWWSATGLCIGLGFLAKYTNAVQGPCLLLWLLLSSRGRTCFRRPGPWVGAAVALLCTLPVWIWNASHHWITFAHLESRGGFDRPARFSFNEFFQFLTLQTVVISPLLWVAIAWAVTATLLRLWQQRRPDWTFSDSSGDQEKELFLITQSLPLWLFFAAFAWNDSGQPNWTVPAYPCAILLACAWWIPRTAKRKARAFAYTALTLGTLLSLALHNTRLFHLPPDADPHSKVRGLHDLYRRVQVAAETHDATFVIAGHYSIAAGLVWNSPAPNETMVYVAKEPGPPQSQFDFWGGYETFLGQNAIYVALRDGDPGSLKEQFESVTPITDIFRLEEEGALGDRHRLFLCRKFLGIPSKP